MTVDVAIERTLKYIHLFLQFPDRRMHDSELDELLTERWAADEVLYLLMHAPYDACPRILIDKFIIRMSRYIVFGKTQEQSTMFLTAAKTGENISAFIYDDAVVEQYRHWEK